MRPQKVTVPDRVASPLTFDQLLARIRNHDYFTRQPLSVKALAIVRDKSVTYAFQLQRYILRSGG